MSPAASTLSQLSDSGQTLSEDSGVDAGETEASTSGRGRQTTSTKSKNGKELPRTERTTEGTNKPVSWGSAQKGPDRGQKDLGIRRQLGGSAGETPPEESLCDDSGVPPFPDPQWQGLATVLYFHVAR